MNILASKLTRDGQEAFRVNENKINLQKMKIIKIMRTNSPTIHRLIDIELLFFL